MLGLLQTPYSDNPVEFDIYGMNHCHIRFFLPFNKVVNGDIILSYDNGIYLDKSDIHILNKENKKSDIIKYFTVQFMALRTQQCYLGEKRYLYLQKILLDKTKRIENLQEQIDQLNQDNSDIAVEILKIVKDY
jgi:hypothetical protein